MLFIKLKYRLNKIFKPIFSKSLEINWHYWIFTFICFISILLLGVNIFRIVQKGYERYEIIQEEKRRLEKLIEQNYKLKEDLKYYSSKEYVDIKAREELNMAFPNQRLVYIEKKESYIDEENKEDEEKITPSWHLWYDLIF